MKTLFYIFIIYFCSYNFLYASPPIAHYQHWTVFQIKKKKNDNYKEICYVMSKPIEKKGTTKKKRSPYMIVMRKKGSKYDEVSLSSGFIFKPHTDITISILKRTFPLFPEYEKAFTYDINDDIEIVKQMKLGAKVYITSYSKSDYVANDTYSLLGFTEAYEKMISLCSDDE